MSVIIINWNGARYLENCLSSILRSDYPSVEVVVIDNASTDDSRDYVAKFPTVRWVGLPTNVGYDKAANAAARMARGEFLLLLNNDTTIEPGTITAFVSSFRAGPQVAICAADVRSYGGNQRFNFGMLLDIFGHPEPELSPEFEDGHFFFADGCAIFTSAEVFGDLGGFDPIYFLYAEDSDLSWRARIWGYRVVKAPGAIVHHLGGGSTTNWGGLQTGQRSRRTRSPVDQARLAQANSISSLLKNCSLASLWFMLPTFLVLSAWKGAVGSIVARSPPRAPSIAEAWMDVAGRWNTIWADRQFVQSKRRVLDVELLSTRVWRGSELDARLRKGPSASGDHVKGSGMHR